MTKNGQLKKGTSASSPGHLCGIEQLVARQAHTLEVAGSSPASVIWTDNQICFHPEIMVCKKMKKYFFTALFAVLII